MTRRCLLVGIALLLCVVLVGCSSGGINDSGNPPGGGGEQTIALGTLQVGVTSAAGFKTVSFDAGREKPVTFTAMYGTRIVRLEERGYGRIAGLVMLPSDNIATANVNGSGYACLYCPATSVDMDYPRWSPDGKKIAYMRNVGDDEIYVMNANGTGQTNITKNADPDYGPLSWSPDGTKLAYYSSRGGNLDIYMTDLPGAYEVQLTDDAEQDREPAWSPDGSKIAFSRYMGGSWEICTMSPQGAGLQNLTNTVDDEYTPCWSPDGSYIAYGRQVGTGDTEIYAMRPDGSSQTALTQNAVDERFPSWSPDGRWIVCESERGTTWELMLIAPDRSALKSVPLGGVSMYRPDWCPVPTVQRALIGKAGADGGANPPFGLKKALAVVGMTKTGLASAMVATAPATKEGTLKAERLANTGADLAGLKITGGALSALLEDRGFDKAPVQWPLTGTPSVGAVLVLFSGDTGRITSAIVVSDEPLEAGAEAAVAGGRLDVRGGILAAYDAREPERNLVSGRATKLTLDARTGEVLEAS